MRVDGSLWDLHRPIEQDAEIEIITRGTEAGLELLRHDAAHVMAEAVKELYPEAQVTIGPAIENGFYYDFARGEAFTPEDLERIEARMKEIVDRDEPITREVWDRGDAIGYFRGAGEVYKAEIIEDLDASQTITVYRQGNFVDLCRGPHLPSTGKLGKAFKTDQARRCILAGGRAQCNAAKDLRHGLAQRKATQGVFDPVGGSGEKGSSQARQTDGPVPFAGGSTGCRVLAPQGLAAVPDTHQLYAGQTECRGLRRSQYTGVDGSKPVGGLGPLGVVR